jgi:hypothetical protein
MKYGLNIKKQLAKTIGRSILSIDIAPALYFIILGISYIQTVKTFLINSSPLYKVVKWFDPFIFLSPAILTYIFLPVIFIIATSLLIQFIWVLQDHCMEISVFKHYIIKISTTSAFVISYVGALPII